ncbi:MAG: hypothetical protein KAH25_07680, partial [Bacteroidales bacterium]|nr:hypothetical protein [Bacteroidales bacterium]
VYPKSKILEIEDIMKKIAEKNAAYDKAIADADGFYKSGTWIEALDNYEIASQIKPEEIYPKEKIAELNALLGDMAATDSKYKALIAEADLMFTNKDYESSKRKYQGALGLKVEEYPQQRIKEIDGILAQIAADQQAYDQLITEADALFGKKDWTSALDKYKGALALKPKEVYPQEQIQIINTKLQNLVDKQSNYEALIAQADQYFDNRKYEAAMLKYEAAAVIFPQETYPPQRISEIRGLLDGLAKQLAEYENLIKEADALLLQGNLKTSKEKYQQAVVVFSNREYPKEQIIKIDALIAKDIAYAEYISQADVLFVQKDYNQSLSVFQQALALFPEREYPQERINEIQSILAALMDTQAAYDEAVRKGDVNFTAADYLLAKENYNEALTYISTEDYPRQKIMEIDQILQDLARKQMQYDELITTADRLFTENKYEEAIGKYKAASGIFPDEPYPPQKIAEINNLLAKILDKKTLYDKLIVDGDAAFNEKDYQNCITIFQQASAIYPSEPYPLQRIDEAKKALALIRNNIDMAYQKAIAQGDKGFGRKNWDLAKQAYKNASEIKPDELYPKEKLAEINSILEAQLKELQNQYDRYIADGDRFYSTKYYQESISSFENALGVFPEEKYPADMIEKIFDLIKKNSMVNILDGNITIYNNKKQQFKFSPVAYKDRKENYILLEVRVVNENAKVKLYVNFGENNSQNGGYSINLKNKKTYSRYFVNLGKQTRWVSKDN